MAGEVVDLSLPFIFSLIVVIFSVFAINYKHFSFSTVPHVCVVLCKKCRELIIIDPDQIHSIRCVSDLICRIFFN